MSRHEELAGFDFEEKEEDGEEDDILWLQAFTGKMEDEEEERREKEKEKEKERAQKEAEEEDEDDPTFHKRPGERRYWEEEDQSLVCYNCNQTGHLRFNCPNEKAGKECFVCGESGHLARDCRKNITCHQCGEKGHFARDCPSKAEIVCRRCHGLGHFARDCTADMSLYCRKCNWRGHLARDCPSEEKKREEERREQEKREERRMDEERYKQMTSGGEDGKRQWEGKEGPPYTKNAFCSNCGSKGHYFGTCRKSTYNDMMKIMEPSWPKDRKKYFQVYQAQKDRILSGEAQGPIEINARVIKEHHKQERREKKKERKREVYHSDVEPQFSRKRKANHSPSPSSSSSSSRPPIRRSHSSPFLPPSSSSFPSPPSAPREDRRVGVVIQNNFSSSPKRKRFRQS